MGAHFGNLLLIAAVGSLTACSTVSTTGPDGAVTVRSRDDFERYVEQVFRYQNSVGNDLISRTASTDELPPALQSAEEHMVESCHALNEIVVATAEGRDPGMKLKSALMRTIGQCDAAAHDLAAVLQGGNKSAAIDSPQHL
jgi:hypothetical protein